LWRRDLIAKHLKNERERELPNAGVGIIERFQHYCKYLIKILHPTHTHTPLCLRIYMKKDPCHFVPENVFPVLNVGNLKQQINQVPPSNWNIGKIIL
jgi:hypothetical protein